IEKRLDEVYASVVNALGQIDALFKEISRQNLNPRTNLYTITTPYRTVRQAVLTIRTLMMYGFLTLMVTVILAPLACIVHYYLRQEILPRELPVARAADDKPAVRAAGPK